MQENCINQQQAGAGSESRGFPIQTRCKHII